MALENSCLWVRSSVWLIIIIVIGTNIFKLLLALLKLRMGTMNASRKHRTGILDLKRASAIKYVSISTVATPAIPATPATPIITPSTECDPSISAHVYHPNRLIVKQECIAVTGTIVNATATQSKHQADGTRHEKDGDTHGWLKVDSGFENLLNSGNTNDEDGNLVFEIISRFPVTQTDAKAACQGYTDQIMLPPVGSHVRIVGRFVQDTFHGQWNEIHPVRSITVIP